MASFDYVPYELHDWGGHIGYANLIRSLLEVIRIDKGSPIELTVCNPLSIERRTDKFFVAYTMWESPDFPADWPPLLDRTDALIVPTQWCKRIFARIYKKPIFVVRPPINSKLFTYVKRAYPTDRPFRWLYCNSMDGRKGWWRLTPIWDNLFASEKNMEIYIKTTMRNPASRGLHSDGNWTIDSRFVSQDELVSLYHSAHAFISPSVGEGFGYGMAEAMATGLPCASIVYGGVSEYFNRFVGYPLPYEEYQTDAYFKYGESEAEHKKYTFAIPSQDGIYKAILDTMQNYSLALWRAKRGSEVIRTYFTEKKFSDELESAYRKCLQLANV